QCGTVPTACLAPTPILSGDLTTCVSCATVDSTTPLWDAENQKCVACATGTEWNGEVCNTLSCSADMPFWNGTECASCEMLDPTRPYWDADKLCVATCPSGKRDGYICVTNCPSERPYLSDGVCVAECSGSKPYRDGANCVSACPSDKPSLDEYNACRACPTRTPVWGESSQTCVTCESIDPEKPYWYEYWSSEKTNACISEDQLCSEAILDRIGITDDTEGVSYTYDTTTNTLTINFANYDEYNEISLWDIDLSPCNLVVNNGFVSVGLVEINSITANNSEGEYGVMIPERLDVIVYGDLIGTGKHYGIINIGHKLTVGGSIIGTAVDATGSISDSFAGGGLPNMGVVNFLDGTISATKITGINYSEDGYGVINGAYSEGGTIIANTISYCQNIGNAGTIVGQISCDCSGTGLTCTENPITTCSGDTPLSVIISEYDGDADEYVQTEECVSCEDIDSSKPYWDEDTQMCIGDCSGDKPYLNDGICVSTCPSGTILAGNQCIDVSCPDGTITYTGTMDIDNDLDISSCDLTVQGRVNINAKLTVKNLTVRSDYGTSIFCGESCEIEASEDVYGECSAVDDFDCVKVLGIINANTVTGWGDYGVVLYGGQIVAQTNVIGLGESYEGIYTTNNASIYAGEDVFGSGITGIVNSGVIHAENVTGEGFDNGGIENYGEIIAEAEIAGKESDWGVEFGYSKGGVYNGYYGIMIAPTISYCKTINNDGSIVGMMQCSADCDCGCASGTTVCEGDTPYCDVNSTCKACPNAMPFWDDDSQKCISCAMNDITTPYWNGNSCVAECSGYKPILSNNLCISCATADVTKPYWTGNECSATCPTDKSYIDNGVCVSICPEDNPLPDENNMCSNWCTQQMKKAGYNTSNFVVSDSVITYNESTMNVSNDLDISSCDLVVKGTLSVKANTTLKVKNISASQENSYSVSNYGTIIAENISGVSVNSKGVYNKGTIIAENISGIAVNNKGVYNEGIIIAESVTGAAETSTAVYNEGGTITATNVYYCQSISNSGKITGTISCNCADSTQCGTVPTACLAPTPILSGDLTTCVSCATVDSTTPLWDAENQKCV
ncbi:MAG: hypothetical protein IJO11_03680, partial [Alphaproteobacteria bacterium]|nr:hypothetical protein [Alphaproteobacteria bacterium]